VVEVLVMWVMVEVVGGTGGGGWYWWWWWSDGSTLITVGLSEL